MRSPKPGTWVWIGTGAVALAVVIAYYVAPSRLADLVYDGAGAVCAAAMAFRCFSLRRGRRVPWGLAAIGVALWVSGDVLASVELNGHADRLSAAGDLLYLLGYPMFVLAIVRAGRLRDPAPDRGRTLEALLLFVAAALPLYEFWIRPALIDTPVATADVVITLAYPALDLLLLATGIRLALGGTGWTAAGVLLGAGLLATVFADTTFNVQTLAGTGVTDRGLPDAGWLLAYLGWTVAALHPSAKALTAPHPRRRWGPLRKPNTLAGLALAGPLTVATISYITGRDVDMIGVFVALGLMSLALALRMRTLTSAERGRRYGLLFGAGAIVVATAVVPVHTQYVTRQRAVSVGELVRAQTDLMRLGGVTAKVETGRLSATGARQEATASARRIDRVLRQRGDRTLRDFGGASLRPGLSRYRALLRHQLALYGHGGPAAAERFGERRTAPAAAQLQRDLVATTDSFRASADANALASRVTIASLFIFSGLVLALLFRRLGAARVEAERAAARSRATLEGERRFRALVARSADIITVIDMDTRVLAYPESVERLLGHDQGTMLGERLDAALSPEDAERTTALLSALRQHPGKSEDIEWTLWRPDGSAVTAEARIRNHADDPHLQGFVLNVRDVTERRELERELEHQACHDPLTGLGNRSLLESRLRHAISRSSRALSLHAVAMIGLDDFKGVNDSLGHDAGDDLLIDVGRRLCNALRGGDTVTRVGGDHFAVLLEDVPDVEQALGTAQRLAALLHEPYTVAGRSIVIGASAGVAGTDGSDFPDAREAAVTAIRNAELAMYEAKRSPSEGGAELFAPTMHTAVAMRVELRADIQRGLDAGEFVPFYQPIVELSSRRVVGFEALVRWQHPERGLVPPGDFIAIAERSGLIIEMGAQILDQATRQLASWNIPGEPRRYMSVNVAGPQIERDAFASEVASAITTAGIAPGDLLLELTETGLIGDTAGNERRLSTLRASGVRLAIDDFGTGYSSLSYLRRFSMDVLKIDKSFIDPMSVGQRSPLVEAMITMARALGLKVIAEGIETPGQAYALMERGCRAGQGYLFSRPLPAAQAEALIHSSAALRTSD